MHPNRIHHDARLAARRPPRHLAGLRSIGLAFALALGAATAQADVSGVSPGGFVVTHSMQTKATPAEVYAAIGHPERWWNAEHTYSHDAANLSMALSAGACFCERWADGSVEHARVIYAGRDRAVRLSGAFGPLQALAVDAVLTLTIAAHDGHTTLQMTYRVSGNADAALDKLAQPVDGVLGEQFRRLERFAATGGV
jgi:uncharacterized protein YndB with AHSA1/START domain